LRWRARPRAGAARDSLLSGEPEGGVSRRSGRRMSVLERFPVDVNRNDLQATHSPIPLTRSRRPLHALPYLPEPLGDSHGLANQIRLPPTATAGQAMAKGYSKDLRVGAIELIEAGDSARESARTLNIGISTAIRWADLRRGHWRAGEPAAGASAAHSAL